MLTMTTSDDSPPTVGLPSVLLICLTEPPSWSFLTWTDLDNLVFSKGEEVLPRSFHGHVDWLRSSSGTILGVCLTPAAELVEVQEALEKHVLTLQPSRHLRIHPDESWIELYRPPMSDEVVDEAASCDQDFPDCGLFRHVESRHLYFYVGMDILREHEVASLCAVVA